MSDELIIEQVTDGSTVTRKWLGLTDKEILFPLFGAVGSAALIMLHNFGVSMVIVAPLIPIPLLLSLLILFLLLYKKPPHYAEDLAEDVWYVFSRPRLKLKSRIVDQQYFLKRKSENKKIRIFSALNHAPQ